MGSTTPKKSMDPIQSNSVGPVQSTSEGPVQNPGQVMEVLEDNKKEEVTLWTYFFKDPKFAKDPKINKTKYPDAICKACKLPVPRALASTKGMRHHLQNRHPKSWEALEEARLKMAKAKVCKVDHENLKFYDSSFPINPNISQNYRPYF